MFTWKVWIDIICGLGVLTTLNLPDFVIPARTISFGLAGGLEPETRNLQPFPYLCQQWKKHV